MRRRPPALLSVSGLVFLLLWAVASLAYRFHIVRSPLLKGALMLVAGVACVLGLFLYCWNGVRWLRSTWEASAP
jgi:hypothetical protein